MTVAALIEKLQSFPPDVEVFGFWEGQLEDLVCVVTTEAKGFRLDADQSKLYAKAPILVVDSGYFDKEGNSIG